MRNPPHSPRYPKASPTGGTLIREVIAFLRAQKIHLPLTSHILCAVSGGSDSIAIAHLLAKYGRRVIDAQKIRLLHINHRWRGAESDRDEEFVRQFAAQHKLPLIVRRLKPPVMGDGSSWEETARNARKLIFEKEATRLKAWVVTAHHADDLAETLLWRLFSGGAATHGGGIVACTGHELRPFLRVRKSSLKQYLAEESHGWREDFSNYNPRFLRARMRTEIMPAVEKLFPRAINHLVELGLTAQKRQSPAASPMTAAGADLGALLGAAGIRARRPHWKVLAEKLEGRNSGWKGEISLPGGWVLSREFALRQERWVLEKSPPKVKSRSKHPE